MLFDGALSALVRARLFLNEGRIAEKGEALSKAINIIDNGLKAGLNMEIEVRFPRTLLHCMTIWFVVCYMLI
jgi:flagellar protein FliS